MKKNSRLLRIFLSFVFSFITHSFLYAKPSQSTLIPRHILFGNPEKFRPQISPNGENLAFLAPEDGVLNIFIAPNGDISQAFAITHDRGRGIRSYQWSYRDDVIIFGQDCDGDENTQLFAVNSKTQEITRLSPKGYLATAVSASDCDTEHLLIAHNQKNPEYFDIYKVNIISGESTLFFENSDQYDLSGFLFDNAFNLKIVSKTNADGSVSYYKYQNGSYLPYMQVSFDDAETTAILGLSKDGETVFIADSRNSDKSTLWSIDLETGLKQLIGASEDCDLSDIILDCHKKQPVAYVEHYLKEQVVFLDPAFENKWEVAASSLPNYTMHIVSRSLSDQIWIIAFTSPTEPARYYWFDNNTQYARFLFSARPELQQYSLNSMEPIIIPTRDGLNMVSYLTLPDQQELSSLTSSYPLVLLVHGGPVCRDYWGYDTEHQWLSNRGFAVLAVNYRSSSGFGKAFIRAGDGEWAGKMHLDLLDAVQWAIDNKITTADQVAIYGGSYGGYAALVGLAMTPDIFRCGIDIVGPSNLETLLDSIPPYWTPYKKDIRRRLGLSIEETPLDADILASKSPLTFADQINKPILIAQGKNDPRVKIQESEQIVDALRENNIPFTYLVFPTEGHGFAKPENSLAFYAIAEQFLGQEFGKAIEPITDEIENANVEITLFTPEKD